MLLRLADRLPKATVQQNPVVMKEKYKTVQQNRNDRDRASIKQNNDDTVDDWSKHVNSLDDVEQLQSSSPRTTVT